MTYTYENITCPVRAHLNSHTVHAVMSVDVWSSDAQMRKFIALGEFERHGTKLRFVPRKRVWVNGIGYIENHLAVFDGAEVRLTQSDVNNLCRAMLAHLTVIEET